MKGLLPMLELFSNMLDIEMYITKCCHGFAYTITIDCCIGRTRDESINI